MNFDGAWNFPQITCQGTPPIQRRAGPTANERFEGNCHPMTIRVHPVPIAVLAGTLLVACGACARNGASAPDLLSTPAPQLPDASDGGIPTPSRTESGIPQRPASERLSYRSHADSVGILGAADPQPPASLQMSGDLVFSLTDDASEASPDALWAADATLSPRRSRQLRLARYRSNLRSALRDTRCKVRSDLENYYSWVTMRDLLIGISAAGVLANTSIDGNFHQWYQEDVRSRGTDHFASFWRTWGVGEIFIPAFVGLGLAGALVEDRSAIDHLGAFGGNVARSYAVGAPPMLLMQFTLGSSRPDETGVGSQWMPFSDDNGVSGHAFIGAVPFLTAARMTENPWIKGGLYVCSTFPGWSRINDRYHYLSQVGLGWWMAYLSCRAVQQTDADEESFSFVPLVTPEMVGGYVVLRR